MKKKASRQQGNSEVSSDSNCDSKYNNLKSVSSDGNAPASSSGGRVSLQFDKIGTGKMKEMQHLIGSKNQ